MTTTSAISLNTSDLTLSRAGPDLITMLRATADRMFVPITTLYWLVSVVESFITGHMLPVWLIGLPALIVPAVLVWRDAGALTTRLVVACALMIQPSFHPDFGRRNRSALWRICRARFAAGLF